MTKKWVLTGVAVFSVLAAAPVHAQLGGRISVEPYIGYGFFGELPETNVELEGGLTYGGRAAYQLASQWAAFGNFQRSNSGVEGSDESLNVDHWSLGVEFSYVPRGGAERMLPILIEAGLGQARYEGGDSDFAVNLGLASAIEMSPRLRIRYGVNDYISNYGDDNGIVNQLFARVGAEFTF